MAGRQPFTTAWAVVAMDSGHPDSAGNTTWSLTLQRMIARWGQIDSQTRAGVDALDLSAFEAVRAHHAQLVAEGRWRSGPTDLMTVLGRTDDELAHSRVVAWLLDPTGRHGLGTAVLHRILAAGWGEPVPDLGLVTVRREVTMSDDVTGAIETSRADIIVQAGSAMLVIENKVWSDEGTRQCEVLHRHWVGRGSDVRFLLLSRHGGLPWSAGASLPEWRGLGYGALRSLLSELTAGTMPTTSAESAVQQYIRALGQIARGPARWTILRGGGT